MKRFVYGIVGFAAFVVFFLLSGCVNLALPLVDEDTGVLATPQPALDSSAAWIDPAFRAAILARFEAEVYGHWPKGAEILSREVRVIDDAAYDGRAVLEQWDLTIDLKDGDPPVHLPLTVAVPSAASPVPAFVMQSFCGPQTAFDRPDVPPPGVPYPSACSGTWLEPVITYVFGRYIGRKPIDDFIDRGVAFVAFYPGEIVPDASEPAFEVLEARFGAYEPRPGAIGLWAWAFSMAVDALDADPRFDSDRTAVYGHSRHGKAALVAGAFDPRIDLVISHQSGRGGASLNRSPTGESVTQITDGYPFWFTPAFASFGDRVDDFSIDQHQLMALIAPRALMLGNARRDAWSDPASSWIAAQTADAIYEALGSDGLNQPDMAAFNPGADLAFFLRNGRHGQTTQDFRAFLSFIDAHFGTRE